MYVVGCVLQCFGPVRAIRTQLQETRTRSGFVSVVDPTHRRFKDWSMGWSVDEYRFVQWRPDSDSFRNCVISCECLFLCHFLFYRYCVLFVLFHVILYYILPVWLAVSLHETLLIVHLNCEIGISLYQYHFMCWQMTVVGLGLVLIYRRPDLTL